jgi:uncharacterized membrane protein
LTILPEFALGAAAVWFAGRHAPALVAMLVNLAIAGRFALTLRPGRVPLITRYARCDPAGLPPEAESYTRRLTMAWSALLLGFALLHSLAMFNLWPVQAITWSQTITVPVFFLGEHVLRTLRLPQLGVATPWRTLAAIWQASQQRGKDSHAA